MTKQPLNPFTGEEPVLPLEKQPVVDKTATVEANAQKEEVIDFYKLGLQWRKNQVRQELAELGVLKRDGYNPNGKYQFFSEAQYKALFTRLFAKHGIEFKATMLGADYDSFTNPKTGTFQFMRRVMMEFTIMDVHTGESETSQFVGEGFDTGDKAIYKAYTGALKYYYADTWQVATGDEPENEKVEEAPAPIRLIEDFQTEIISKFYTGDNMTKLLGKYGIKTLGEMTYEDAKQQILDLKKMLKDKDEQNKTG
jgi:hypothetical protein